MSQFPCKSKGDSNSVYLIGTHKGVSELNTDNMQCLVHDEHYMY